MASKKTKPAEPTQQTRPFAPGWADAYGRELRSLHTEPRPLDATWSPPIAARPAASYGLGPEGRPEPGYLKRAAERAKLGKRAKETAAALESALGPVDAD